MPGLAGLQRVDNLVIFSSLMIDLASFSGLLCSRKIKILADILTSLEGLNQLQALDSGSYGPAFSLEGANGGAVANITIEDLAALRLYAACGTNSGSLWTKKSLVLMINVCGGPVRLSFSLVTFVLRCMLVFWTCALSSFFSPLLSFFSIPYLLSFFVYIFYVHTHPNPTHRQRVVGVGTTCIL